MAVVTMRQLLEAGIHFGHQTRRWNPKMARYIFGQRNGIYIIDLQKTLRQVHKAYAFVRDTVAGGGTVLFVGTKKQAQEPVAREAARCGMYYVNHRWLGGTLTNFETIQTSVRNYVRLEEMESNGTMEKYSKKEAAKMRRELAKLRRNLEGIKTMDSLPSIMFVIDSKKEAIAVREAERLGITCIGIVDTNADPDCVPLPIPGNDDAIRAVTLFCSIIADATLDGLAQGEKIRAENSQKAGRGRKAYSAGDDQVDEAKEDAEVEPTGEAEAQPAEVGATAQDNSEGEI